MSSAPQDSSSNHVTPPSPPKLPSPSSQDATLSSATYYARHAAITAQTIGAWITIVFGFGFSQIAFKSCSTGSGGTSALWGVTGLVGLVLGTAAIGWVKHLRQVRRSLVNRYAQQTHSVQRKPYILYLRSFKSDEHSPESDMVTFSAFGLGGLTQKTSEQSLVADVKAYNSRYEMLAVGHPDEELPPLGCIRYSFPNETWQQEVDLLAKQARAILVLPGVTPAVIWETEHLIRAGHPSRVYILAWGSYPEWREKTQHLFPHPLPEPEDAGGIIAFTDDWLPVTRGDTGLNIVTWMMQRIEGRSTGDHVLASVGGSVPPPIPKPSQNMTLAEKLQFAAIILAIVVIGTLLYIYRGNAANDAKTARERLDETIRKSNERKTGYDYTREAHERRTREIDQLMKEAREKGSRTPP